MIQDSPHTVTSGLSNSATAKQSHYKPEILVVDAYSTDNTTELASRAGATVIQQPTQIYPAKGLAMRAGLEESIRKSGSDIIIFLDADIKNLTSEWVDNLVKALIDDNCDMSRGFYTRHARDAAVTKLIARPCYMFSFPNYLTMNNL